MKFSEFNETEKENAETLLKTCAHIPSWIRLITEQRPYPNRDALFLTAKNATSQWQWPEIEKALAQHPKIGEKKASIKLSAQEALFSKTEQATLSSDYDFSTQIHKANLDYETRFGHIFLIRAAGRNAKEILAEATRRIKNTPEQEQLETIKQLSEIALLRLNNLITKDDP